MKPSNRVLNRALLKACLEGKKIVLASATKEQGEKACKDIFELAKEMGLEGEVRKIWKELEKP